MFQPLELAQIVYQKPFRPLRVYRKDGRTYEIPYPNMAVVCMETLDVGIQADDYPPGITARIVRIPLEEVERVEPVAVPGGSVGG
jgi:hypothetical protein